jgi:hypothetical protein
VGEMADALEDTMLNMADEMRLPPWATSDDFDFADFGDGPIKQNSPRKRLTNDEAQALFDYTPTTKD